MQRIIPHLWFDTQAQEAAAFYTSLFENSQINNQLTLHNTPSGSVDQIDLTLAGVRFIFLNAGPLFTFTPAISFMVSCNSVQEVGSLWEQLSPGGLVMMELGKYPFSEKYGWVQDKFGVSWQIMLTGDQAPEQKITPTLMFVGDVCGKTEEAVQLYTSIFENSKINFISRYGNGMEPNKPDHVNQASFTLDGFTMAAMDSALEHHFSFNEAISFVVECDTQAEIDQYWEKLSAVPEAEQCGWLQDAFGLSWQIVPTIMNEMYNMNDPAKLARVTETFLQMKKFDLQKLKAAMEE